MQQWKDCPRYLTKEPKDFLLFVKNWNTLFLHSLCKCNNKYKYNKIFVWIVLTNFLYCISFGCVVKFVLKLALNLVLEKLKMQIADVR